MAKGKTYRSKFSAFRVNVRSEAIHVHPSTGVVISKTPPLVAEFAKHGAEYEYKTVDGQVDKAADIRGHFFNTASAQQENKWTDEERESVEAVLDHWCERWPEAVWVTTVAKTEKPWPTYDDVHHKQIPTLAETLGLVAEALAYERENKNRGEVVEKLSELVNAAETAAVAEQSLTAA